MLKCLAISLCVVLPCCSHVALSEVNHEEFLSTWSSEPNQQQNGFQQNGYQQNGGQQFQPGMYNPGFSGFNKFNQPPQRPRAPLPPMLRFKVDEVHDLRAHRFDRDGEVAASREPVPRSTSSFHTRMMHWVYTCSL